MALIDLKCLACGKVFEAYRRAEDWPWTPGCESCFGPTEQIHLPKQVQWTVDPVLVFKAPDGSYRFPGDSRGLSAANYSKLGYERVEIRGAVEMRSFETRMNRIEYARAQRQVERKQEARERREQELRSELRSKMQSMSALGQAVARAAMQRNDQKQRERPADANFHNEAYSFDRSSRDESRDAEGRRRRD